MTNYRRAELDGGNYIYSIVIYKHHLYLKYNCDNMYKIFMISDIQSKYECMAVYEWGIYNESAWVKVHPTKLTLIEGKSYVN